MTGRGFEWFVAWRHLRDDEQRTHRTLIGGLALIAGGVIGFVAQHLVLKRHPMLFVRGALLFDNLKIISVGAMVIGTLIAILGLLFAFFTVFTAFSMFGVFLGTGVPILALSIMSGFEMDLKSKIRATKTDDDNKHTNKQPFTDWQAVKKKIADVPGVGDSMAYVESEVIIKHISNPAGMGIILRGVEVDRTARVLDLPRTLKEGSIDLLAHPERIQPDFPAPPPPEPGDNAPAQEFIFPNRQLP